MNSVNDLSFLFRDHIEWDPLAVFESCVVISICGIMTAVWMFHVVSSSPDFKKFPIITTEIDPR